jgi:cytochrome c
MSRHFWITAAALMLLGCTPSATDLPSSGPTGTVPSAPVTAAEFDVGPIESAQAYLAEPRYADADLERGELLSLGCIACHTFKIGEPHLLGPNLGGIFGSQAAGKDGFDYSPALEATGPIWTPPALEAWLARPAGFVPGTSMVFAGYGADSDRRDLVAYLLRMTQESAQ